jgi:hypothetical protein
VGGEGKSEVTLWRKKERRISKQEVLENEEVRGEEGQGERACAQIQP